MKGIILAAGKGTRLYPMTKSVPKPLLPVYDKPLIYYSISVLIQAGIRDILIIIPPNKEQDFIGLLGYGKQFGINISYAVQHEARGIADAFIVGGDFIGNDNVCLVLGDNIFWSENFGSHVRAAGEKVEREGGAAVFGYWVEDPRPFGVVEFGADGRAVSIEEKPREPKSKYIIPGLYFYDNGVKEIARQIKPSARGELEITDVNVKYMNRGELSVVTLDRDLLWKDAGSAANMLDASVSVKEKQEEMGIQIGCIEEQAWRAGFITKERLGQLGQELSTTEYGKHILSL